MKILIAIFWFVFFGAVFLLFTDIADKLYEPYFKRLPPEKQQKVIEWLLEYWKGQGSLYKNRTERKPKGARCLRCISTSRGGVMVAYESHYLMIWVRFPAPLLNGYRILHSSRWRHVLACWKGLEHRRRGYWADYGGWIPWRNERGWDTGWGLDVKLTQYETNNY